MEEKSRSHPRGKPSSSEITVADLIKLEFLSMSILIKFKPVFAIDCARVKNQLIIFLLNRCVGIFFGRD